MRIRSLCRVFGAALAIVVPHAANAQPYAYVANSGSDSVSVIDTATNTVVATVPVGDTPVEVAVGFGGARVYVANVNGASVSVINAATHTIVTTIPVGASPNGVTVSPDGSRVYVACTGAGTISVIDTGTNTVIATVPRPSAHGLAPSPDGTRVYVVGGNHLSVLDVATNTLVGNPVPLVASNPFRIAVTPDGLEAYVTHFGTPKVSAVNLLDESAFPVDLPPGMTGTFGVAVSPDGARVWVADTANHTIAAIDTYLKATVAQFLPGGLSLYDVDVTRDGTHLYIANRGSNTVSMFNPVTSSVVPIPVGLQPASIAIADGPVSIPARYAAAVDVAYGLPSGAAQLTLVGAMTLGTTSDGANPLTEFVVVGVGGKLTLTIPAGSFQTVAPGLVAFSGEMQGRMVQAWIQDLGAGSHLIVARVTGNLAPLTVPLRLLLQIGDDIGGAPLRRGVIQ